MGLARPADGDRPLAVGLRTGVDLNRLQRPLRPVLACRYPIIAVAALAFSLQHLRGTGLDWRYFVEGSELLFGQHRPSTPFPGGLHLYASYPDFQIGPLSFLVAAPIRIIGGANSRIVGSLLMTAVGPLLVYVLDRASRIAHPPACQEDELLRRITVLFGGLLVAAAWAPLAAIYAHLDDVLTIAAGVGAVWAVATRRPIVAGILLGAAFAAKPWGVVALPLAFAFRGRCRVTALGVAAAVSIVAWAPFVLADPATLDAVRPQNRIAPESVLHLLGVPLMDAPTWVRALQLVTALVAGLIAILRGRWEAVLLVGIAVRVALDSQTFLYYGTGLIVAAFAWDLLRARRTYPLATLFAFVFLNDSYVVFADPMIRASTRLILTVALVVTVLVIRSDLPGPVRVEQEVTAAPI